MKLVEHEIRVLRTLNGEGDFIGGWGAWVGAVLETLYSSGLARVEGGRAVITDAGRAALEALPS